MSVRRTASRPYRNLGETRLKHRRRQHDPMKAFDALPPELRRWMASAMLPWSPTSCRKIWDKARSEGLDAAETLARLDRAEAGMLAKAQRS